VVPYLMSQAGQPGRHAAPSLGASRYFPGGSRQAPGFGVCDLRQIGDARPRQHRSALRGPAWASADVTGRLPPPGGSPFMARARDASPVPPYPAQ
jgi:hypothetical protein